MTYEMEFGERLYKARKNAGMTQMELADQVGVTDRAIGNWENGHNAPTSFNVCMLAKTLGVSAGWLIAGEEEV